jgi:hypothetical protein
VGAGDVLYPYSSVFLAALPEAGEAHGLPRGQAQSLLAAVERLEYPVRQLFVAIPSGNARFGNVQVAGEISLDSWIIVSRPGPFANEVALLQAIYAALQPVHAALLSPVPEPLAGWFDLNAAVLCESLLTKSARCGK